MIETIKNLLPPKRSEEYAHEMGYDCEMNGANETNCHFSIFSSRENTRAWEDGKRAARETKAKAVPTS